MNEENKTNDLDILEQKSKELEEPKKESEDTPERIVIGNLTEQKDPKYIYFIDSGGAITKMKKGGKKGKRKRRPRRDIPLMEKYQNVNISIPKLLFSSYIPNGYKKVGKFSDHSGYLFVHKDLIGKEFKLIMIPKEEWENQYANYGEKN